MRHHFVRYEYHDHETPTTLPGAWWRDFIACLNEQSEQVSLEGADLIVIDVDPMVAHYPAFLEACVTYPGGRKPFAIERSKRWWHLWGVGAFGWRRCSDRWWHLWGLGSFGGRRCPDRRWHL